MKILQSNWSCNQSNLLQFNAGWVSPEYNLMSWALSCLQLKKFYGDVCLYTDDVSAKILIDELHLPYANVFCDLDKLNNYHPQLWALPKIYTYAQQETPFLHVDGDVFIWEQFDKSLLEGELITQNEEAATDYYEAILRSLESGLSYFPSEIADERKLNRPVHAYNAGIMGGHDIAFFKNYSAKAFEFVENNKDSFSKIYVSNFNIFFEQYLFYCLAKKEGKEVKVLLKEIIDDNRYKGFGDFVEVPYNKKYLHLIGDYKRNKSVCEQLACRLRQDYPEYYYRIIALFKDKKTPLFKDYFWFETDTTEESLLNRNHFLKGSLLKGNLPKTTTQYAKNTRICESTYFRMPLVKSTIQTAKIDEEKVTIHLQDIERFELELFEIVEDKFNNISLPYLYARDICNTSYPEYIFGEPLKIFEKTIVADNLCKVIESQFEWMTIDFRSKLLPITIAELLKTKESLFYNLVIPECDQYGYSLTGIDELDCLLLQTIKEPITINILFEQLKLSFDVDDLASSLPEFEKLIFGRIKNGLLNKSIKAIISIPK